MNTYKLLRRSYDEKFQQLRQNLTIRKPPQGWIKTIRELFGMTTIQFAKKLGITQPRVTEIEKNEKNLKISTFEKICNSIDCEFVYFIVPKDNIQKILQNRAKKKALKIINKTNENMRLENQLIHDDWILDDLIEDLLDNNLARIWDEDD